MTKKIEIVFPTGIFPAAVFTDHTAVLGKTGSGKTSTAKLIVEAVVERGGRVCILDPTKSDWWGITVGRNGKSRGLPFDILGGPKAHVPLPASAGAAIGELVATGAVQLSILDMADFGPGDQQRFFVAFAQALLKKMRGAVYLVMEEAHEFAPKERAGFDKENMAIHFAKKLATAGRSKGIKLLVLTQRTQSLHNALLGSCETLIAHRMTQPADQLPVINWLKANAPKEIMAEVASSLSSLKTGTGWLCSGEAAIFERREFPRISTYDNSATPDGSSIDDVKPAPIDVGKLKELLGEAVAEAEANDPTELKKQVERLRRDLEREKAHKPQPAAAKSAAVRCKITDKELAEAIEPIIKEHSDKVAVWTTSFQENLKTSLDKAFERSPKPVAIDWGKALSRAVVVLNKQPGSASQKPAIGTSVGSHTGATVQIQRTPIPTYSPSNNAEIQARGEISKPMMRILKALADLEAIGQLKPSRPAVAFWAETSSTSSSFQKNVGMLNTMGLITYPDGGRIAITDAGRRESPQAETLTSDEVFARGLDLLSKPQQRILSTLKGVYPESLDRENLAIASDSAHSSSSFQKNVGEMRTAGLVEYVDRGKIRAAEWLFV